MAPVFELHHVGVGNEQPQHRYIRAGHDLAAVAHDAIDVAVVDRLLQQYEALPDIGRQMRRQRGVRLADTTAQMRGEMQDLHAGTMSEVDTGSKQHFAMRVDIVGQTVGELPALAADGMIAALAPQMLEAELIHRPRIPDRAHRFLTHVADDEFAAPVQKTRTHQAVGVDRVAVENIRAHVGRADVLLVDALGDHRHQYVWRYRTAASTAQIFDENAVTMVAEGVEECLTFRLVDKLGRDLDHDLAAAPIVVEPLDVFTKLRRPIRTR